MLSREPPGSHGNFLLCPVVLAAEEARSIHDLVVSGGQARERYGEAGSVEGSVDFQESEIKVNIQ